MEHLFAISLCPARPAPTQHRPCLLYTRITLLTKFAGFPCEGKKHPHHATNEWNISSPSLYAPHVLLQRSIGPQCFGLDAGPRVGWKLTVIFHLFLPIFRRGGGSDDGLRRRGSSRPVRCPSDCVSHPIAFPTAQLRGPAGGPRMPGQTSRRLAAQSLWSSPL